MPSEQLLYGTVPKRGVHKNMPKELINRPRSSLDTGVVPVSYDAFDVAGTDVWTNSVIVHEKGDYYLLSVKKAEKLISDLNKAVKTLKKATK